MMPTHEPIDVEPSEQADTEVAYRHYIADLIMSYASQNKELDNAETFRRVMAVTGRTLTTVKNWLHYKTNLPDLASISRMVQHWHIPPRQIFAQPVEEVGAMASTRWTARESLPFAEPTSQLLVSPYRQRDHSQLDRALIKYTDHPRATLLVRYDSSDMLDEIRPGELMLADPTFEEINGSGLYLLRFNGLAGRQITCVRHVDVLLGERAVRLSCGAALPNAVTETVSLEHEALPPHITVLAKIVAVLKHI